MPLVVLEGDDGTGKTTVIQRLKEKYPHIESLAFPTQELKEKIPTPDVTRVWDTLDQVFRYHIAFMYDFNRNQERIYNLLKEKKVVLLDRYYISNLVYLLYDVARTGIKNYGFTIREVNETYAELWPILKSYYDQLEDTDLIIWLDKDDTLISMLYGKVLEEIDNAVKIKALRPEMFLKVESELLQRGYL